MSIQSNDKERERSSHSPLMLFHYTQDLQIESSEAEAPFASMAIRTLEVRASDFAL